MAVGVKSRIIIGFLVLATATLAVPPEAGMEIPIEVARPVQPVARPGKAPRLPSVYGLLPYLKTGLVAVLLASQGLGAGTQPGPPPFLFGTLPAINLSATDPVSLMVAQGVGLAMNRANASGGLPSLSDFNNLLAQNSPSGTSVLATLPASALAAPDDDPPDEPGFSSSASGYSPPMEATPQLPSFLLNYPSGQPFPVSAAGDLATKLSAAQTDLSVAQLTTGFYIQEAIGNQLLAIGTPLVLVNETIGIIIQAVGFELASLGFFTASEASNLNVIAAQASVTDLQQKVANATAGAKGEAHALINPHVLYGTWLREPVHPSNETIIYQFAPTEFVKINTTLEADGLETTEIERHTGTISTSIKYRHPPGNASAADAVGKISVRMVVPLDCAPPLVLSFYYLRVKGDQIGRDSEQEFDTLVEQDEEKSLYVKVSK